MTTHEEIRLKRVGQSERPALYGLVDDYLRELHTHREIAAGPADAASYVYLPMYWEGPIDSYEVTEEDGHRREFRFGIAAE